VRRVVAFVQWWRSLTLGGRSNGRSSSSYLVASGAALLVTTAMLPARGTLGVLNVLLIYLLLSFVSALVLGPGPAAFGVVVAFLAFDFFYIPPFHTFTAAKPAHVLALFIYLGIAIVTGQLVSRVRSRTEAAAVLAQSDQLKSALLAAVSHDLRTPLAAIKASATSLLDSSVNWDERSRTDFLSAINEETDRLTLMVSNLLDLSRIEAGVLKPDKEWYDVAELIEDVAARMTARAEESGHQLITDVQPDLPLTRFGYVEIAQVLTNLTENALKYTPPGTRITLAGRLKAGEIELAVRDSGPGIPESELNRIFDKFYRLDPRSRISGSGMGLAISKGLVEAHGGRIRAERGPSGGTIIRFTIPLPPNTDRARTTASERDT
jgi:K+-sensing histidine kinase KdpD